MEKIITAIWGIYNANAALKTALPGGMFLNLAPQSATLPYATFFVVSANPEYWFAGRMFELTYVQFDIYADTNAKLFVAYNALLSIYDDARPAVTGYTAIIIERKSQQFMRDGDQNQYHRAMITYEGRFLKS